MSTQAKILVLVGVLVGALVFGALVLASGDRQCNGRGCINQFPHRTASVTR